MTRRRFLRPMCLFVLLGGVALTAPGAHSSPQDASGSSLLQSFRGHVLPSRQVQLTAPIEEILIDVAVEEGQRVKKGQVLAQLDDRLQEVVVEAAQLRADSDAEMRRTSLEVEEAEDNLARIESAFEQGAATEMELRRATIEASRVKAAHVEAIENRALAQVNLKLEQRRLDRYRIVAPFNGTVVRILAEPGAMLTDRDPILVLADLDTLEAQLNVPAALYGQLQIGRTFKLSAAQPVNGDVEAKLKTVDPVVDTASQTFRCVLTIDNAPAELPAGFTVQMAWGGKAETGVVPAIAQVEDERE